MTRPYSVSNPEDSKHGNPIIMPWFLQCSNGRSVFDGFPVLDPLGVLGSGVAEKRLAGSVDLTRIESICSTWRCDCLSVVWVNVRLMKKPDGLIK